MLPGASKAVVAVSAFSLHGLSTSSSFKLPYRLIFVVATLNSLYVYDTEGSEQIAISVVLHYTAITDVAWFTMNNMSFIFVGLHLTVVKGKAGHARI